MKFSLKKTNKKLELVHLSKKAQKFLHQDEV